MKILMITQDWPVTRRILQEAHSLINANYDVHILTRAPAQVDTLGKVEGIPVQALAVQGRDPRFGWLYRLAGHTRGSQAAALWSVLSGRHTFTLRALPVARAARAAVYHAHDLNNLYVAHAAAQATGARLVYDSHELFPEIANRWIRMKRRAWIQLERRLLPAAQQVITVNEFIAAEMARRYGCPPPLVVYNCPDPPATFSPEARYDLLHTRLGGDPQRPLVLYQGWMAEGRGLENLVRAAPLLARDALVVMMGYGVYQEALERLAAREAPGRVAFLPAVPQHELLAACASADVGVIPYQAVDLNNYYTSPNKLFDFIQAAVPIVASDLPFLRQVVGGHSLGVVATLDSPASYAQAINAVLTASPAEATARRARLRAIAPQYTWQAQGRKLVAAYAALTGVGA